MIVDLSTVTPERFLELDMQVEKIITAMSKESDDTKMLNNKGITSFFQKAIKESMTVTDNIEEIILLSLKYGAVMTILGYPIGVAITQPDISDEMIAKVKEHINKINSN